jgi:hypothetical protein
VSTAVGDLVVQHTSTAGTGTLTLTTAVAPYLTAAQSGFRDGDTVDYSIADGTSNSESGFGVLSASQTTLTRNPLSSTNSNNAISLSGSATVRLTPLRRAFEALSKCAILANYGII